MGDVVWVPDGWYSEMGDGYQVSIVKDYGHGYRFSVVLLSETDSGEDDDDEHLFGSGWAKTADAAKAAALAAYESARKGEQG